jgi:hypothetical protein
MREIESVYVPSAISRRQRCDDFVKWTIDTMQMDPAGKDCAYLI